jgi:5-methylcytosine-specific restriction endonuclease McrA
METISKNNEAAANSIIDSYLTWAKTQVWYGVNNDHLYSKLGLVLATGFNNKQRLIDTILLPEQSNRCCYCMRRIVDHSDEASIEHIIPQSTTSNTILSHYFSARSGGLNSANVCLSPDFINNGSVPPPYPHHVAYHNFVIACRTCNSKRWHLEIDPLFLFSGINAEVNYNQYTGEAKWLFDPAYSDPAPVFPTLEKAGVNRPILKAIRVVWFYLKRNGLTPSAAKRDELIYGAIGDSLSVDPSMSDEDFNAFIDLNTAGMWDLFLKYDYFG